MSIGVLVMAYGTPGRREEVLEYYTDIRRGHPPSPEQLSDLQRRYDAIGGLSPLNKRSAAQIKALQAGLEALAPGQYLTAYGTKHATPSIASGVDQLLQDGAEKIVGLVLAPHYSFLSVGDYIARAEAQLAARAVRGAFIKNWGEDPTLIELLAARLNEAIARTGFARQDVAVLFSAHSLPQTILQSADPYPDELVATAALVAARAGLDGYRIAYQSAGRTGQAWLGPDVGEVLDAVRSAGYAAAVVCPAGFTSDHLEILYDLDIEARQRAEALGLGFARTESLNDDGRLFTALARRVIELANSDLG